MSIWKVFFNSNYIFQKCCFVWKVSNRIMKVLLRKTEFLMSCKFQVCIITRWCILIMWIFTSAFSITLTKVRYWLWMGITWLGKLINTVEPKGLYRSIEDPKIIFWFLFHWLSPNQMFLNPNLIIPSWKYVA